MQKRAEPPRGKRPERTQATRAVFPEKNRPALSPGQDEVGHLVASERYPAEHGDLWVEGVYAGGRSLLVLNPGYDATADSEAGFMLCNTCGRAEFSGQNTPRRHAAPYHKFGKACCGPIGVGPKPQQLPVALGHRYETDVLWLDFQGAGRGQDDIRFWLSLAYAITSASALALNIERNDLDVTTKPLLTERRQAIVLYDTVPGGAGHCRRILDNLPTVVRKARDLLSNCTCDPDSTGCYGCLCDYQNQFAHDYLSRGESLTYLDRLVDELDRDTPSPWRTPSRVPWRDIVDSVRAVHGPIRLTTDSIKPGPIPGFNRDWFDVLTEAAMGDPKSMTIVLGSLPEKGRSPDETLTYHRLSELQTRGVTVLECVGPLPTHASFVLDTDGKVPASVWRWPWQAMLAPDMENVQRNRLGRDVDALRELGPQPATRPATFPVFKAFHHFVLEPPGVAREPFEARYLGRLLAHPVQRMLLIDPYILSGPTERDALDRFLGHLRVKPNGEIRVKTRQLRRTPGPHDFRNESEQDNARKGLLGKYAATFDLQIDVARRFAEHDRSMVLEVLQNGDARYYRVLLGQGLFGFESACQNRSEGVWFEINEMEFLRDWTGSR